MGSSQNSPPVGSDPWPQMTGSDQKEGMNRLRGGENILFYCFLEQSLETLEVLCDMHNQISTQVEKAYWMCSSSFKGAMRE